jgi:tetratricopeptide (TPR) repeat protein
VSEPFEVAHVTDLDAIPTAEGLVWHPVRRRFGILAFGINAWTAEEIGGHVVERHTESSGHEEVYFVAAGRARFTIGGEEVDAPAGTFVYLRDPLVEREAIAEDEGTLVVAVGGWPGKPFEPSAWESWYVAIPAYKAKDYDRAIEILEKARREHPDHPVILSSLASLEDLRGNHEAGVEMLIRALEIRPNLREHVLGDDDYAGLREDPRIAPLLADERAT